MPKNLEKYFRAEVNRRKQQERKPLGQKVRIPLLIAGMAIGLICLSRQCSLNSPVNNPIYNKIVSQINKPTPITLPQTGVLNQYIQTPNKKLGLIRFFLRAPLPGEKSSLSTACPNAKNSGSMSDNNHYFVKLIDWQSDAVITTAFIRSGDMVEIFVPFGSYKLRYATGTEWYGEQARFGSEDMYEITEQFSLEAARLDFTPEKTRSDISANCVNGNLGRKRIKDNSLPPEKLPGKNEVQSNRPESIPFL